ARDIALANVPLQQETYAPQDDVARAVAQGVVDTLEVIDIQSDYGESVLLAVRARQLPQEEFLEKAAVVQTGERITDRLFMQGVANSQVGEREAGFFGHSRREIQTGVDRIGIFRRCRFLFHATQMQQTERLALCEDRDAKIGWDRTRIRRHVSTEQLGPRISDPVSLRLAQGPAILDCERLLARRPVAPACNALQMLPRRMNEIQLAVRSLEQLRTETFDSRINFGLRHAGLQIAAQFAKDKVMMAQLIQIANLVSVHARHACNRETLTVRSLAFFGLLDCACERPGKIAGVGLENVVASPARECFDRGFFLFRFEDEDERRMRT